MACRYCAFNAAWGSDYKGRGTLKSFFTRSFIIFTGTAFFLSFLLGVPFVVRNNLSSVLSIHTHNLKHEAQPYAAGSW